MKKMLSIACFAFSVFAFAAPALADDTAKPAASKEVKSKDYGYTFDDDPLNSNVQGTTCFILKLRPPAARQLLSRPRVSFVPEMLKTVEAL